MYVKLGKCTFCQDSWHLGEDRGAVAQRNAPPGERLTKMVKKTLHVGMG